MRARYPGFVLLLTALAVADAFGCGGAHPAGERPASGPRARYVTLTPRARAREARELAVGTEAACARKQAQADAIPSWSGLADPELSAALRRHEEATAPLPTLASGLAPEADGLASEVASAALGLGGVLGFVSPLEAVALPLVTAHADRVIEQAEEAMRETAAQNLALALQRHAESDLARRLEALEREQDVVRVRSEVAALLTDPALNLAPQGLSEQARLLLVEAHVRSVQRRTYAAVAVIEDDVAGLQTSMARLARAATALDEATQAELGALRAETERLGAHQTSVDAALLEVLPPERAHEYLVSGALGGDLLPEERARRIDALRSAVVLRRARDTVLASREFVGALRDVSHLLPPALRADVERAASFGAIAVDVAAAILETPTNPLAAVRIVARLLGGGGADATATQLQELRRDLSELRRHVDQRFDRIEEILETNHRAVMSKLDQLGARLDRIERILIEHAGADLRSCAVVSSTWQSDETERARLPLRLLEHEEIRTQASDCRIALRRLFVPGVSGLAPATQAFFRADEAHDASRIEAEMGRVRAALQRRNVSSIDVSRDPVVDSWGATDADAIEGRLDMATPTDSGRVGATVLAALQLTPVFELQSDRTGEFCTAHHYASRSGPCSPEALPARTVGDMLLGYLARIDGTEQQARYRAAWPLFSIWYERVLRGSGEWTPDDAAVLRENETATIEFGRYLVARGVRDAGGSLAGFDYALRRRSGAALSRALGSPAGVTFDFASEAPAAICAGVRVPLPTGAELERRAGATAFLSGLGTVRAAVEREHLGADYYFALSVHERRLVDRLFETVSSTGNPWRAR